MENFQGALAVKNQESPLRAEFIQTPSSPFDQAFADKLDKVLQDYAQSKSAEDPCSIQMFKTGLIRFCNSSDKKSAFDELAQLAGSLEKLSTLEKTSLNKERFELIASSAQRKQLNLDLRIKQREFNEKTFEQLSPGDYLSVYAMMQRKLDEKPAEYQERVRKGLAPYPEILNAFNEELAAEARVEASKTPREKQLEQLVTQISSSLKEMDEQVMNAYRRSILKNP